MENIRNNELLKKVLKDSFGGICYMVENLETYDQDQKNELLKQWENLNENEKMAMGGIIKGAINFLKGN